MGKALVFKIGIVGSSPSNPVLFITNFRERVCSLKVKQPFDKREIVGSIPTLLTTLLYI